MLLERLMSDFQRRSSMENYRRESALKLARRNATKTPSKPLKDFDIPMGSCERAAQERSKRRGLINKGAALYEGKRISVDETKHKNA